MVGWVLLEKGGKWRRDGLVGGRDFLEGREFGNRCGGGRGRGNGGGREIFLILFLFLFLDFLADLDGLGRKSASSGSESLSGEEGGVVGEEGEGARGNIYFFYISCSFFYLQFHDFKTNFLFPEKWHFISTTRRK